MVAAIDTCTGPRAYAGVVYAYHEQVTENFARMTDQEWATRFQTAAIGQRRTHTRGQHESPIGARPG